MASPRHRVKVGHSQDWGLELDTQQGTHEQQEPDVQHFLRYVQSAVQSIKLWLVNFILNASQIFERCIVNFLNVHVLFYGWRAHLKKHFQFAENTTPLLCGPLWTILYFCDIWSSSSSDPVRKSFMSLKAEQRLYVDEEQMRSPQDSFSETNASQSQIL